MSRTSSSNQMVSCGSEENDAVSSSDLRLGMPKLRETTQLEKDGSWQDARIAFAEAQELFSCCCAEA
jgi:hypothetical protein